MVPKVRFDFTLDGRPHVLEFRRVPLQAWRDIKAETGLTPKTLLDALGESDVDAVIASVFASRNAEGRRQTFRQTQRELEDVEEFVPTRVEVDGEVMFGDDEAGDVDPPTSDS